MTKKEVEITRRMVAEQVERRRLAEEEEIEFVVRGCVRAAGKSARRGLKTTTVVFDNVQLKHLYQLSWSRIIDILTTAGYTVSESPSGHYMNSRNVYYDIGKNEYITYKQWGRRSIKYDYHRWKEFSKAMSKHGISPGAFRLDISV